MIGEAGIMTYVIAEPFPAAVKALRQVLSSQHLKITGELNISGRIWRSLLIGTAPCVVLFVWPPAVLRDTLDSDSCAAALAPLHVVVSDRGLQSEVHVLRMLPRDGGLVDGRAVASVNQTQAEIVQAIEKIGMRVSLSA